MSRKLLRSTSTVAAMTMLSRILGFVRDVIFAEIFGAGVGFDAFVVAFKLPNFFRRLFGEGAFAQAFVPVLAEYKEQRPHEDVREFINRIAGSLATALIVVVILAEIGAPWIIRVFAPGFAVDGARFVLATHMLHWTFPYLFFIALTAFAGAVLNTFSKFALPAFTPVLLNVTFIAVALWWAPHTQDPILALAWGVMIAGILQLLIQLPFLSRSRVLPHPKWGWSDPGVRRVLKLMLPALFGVSVAQISLLVDNFFASFLPAGSISWLYYSDRITYLPLGVIGVALSTVVLPQLAKQFSKGSHIAYSTTLDWALRSALVVGLPAAFGLFVLAGPILVTLIHHGAFNTYDVIMTRKSLMAYALGLPGFMLVKVLASGFYSRQNIKTPVKIAAVCVALNIIFNMLLIHPMAHAGLALSTALSSTINAGLLWYGLQKRGFYNPQSPWLRLVWRMAIAVVVMVAVVYFLSGSLALWLSFGIWHAIGRLLLCIVVGVIFYVGTLWVLGLRKSDFMLQKVSE
jgi:putative peptidoglycan lipid II flippase